MNMLEYINSLVNLTNVDYITKEDVREIMLNGYKSDKEELWRKVEELGGYEALDE